MNLTVSKKAQLQLAGQMATVAERKSTMPILVNVLLRADGARLTAHATDLYQSLIGSIEADVKVSGAIAVPATDFLSRIKMMPEGPITLTASGDSLSMKAAGTARRYTLRGMPGDDFPPLAKPDGDAKQLTIDPAVLAELIARTHFSISTDETRPHINSALVEWEAGLVRMVSTDGHRLSKAERRVEGMESFPSMLLPLKGIREVHRIADDLYAGGSGEDRPKLGVSISGNSAFFTAGSSTFSVKLVDAQFPPYAQVIPKTSDRTVRLPRAALADAIKAVSVAASDRTGGIRLSFAKGVLTLTSESPDSGEGRDELPYEMVDGKDGALVAFKASYLTDILGVLACEQVDFGMSGEIDPLVVKPVGPDADAALFIAMSMRI